MLIEENGRISINYRSFSGKNKAIKILYGLSDVKPKTGIHIISKPGFL